MHSIVKFSLVVNKRNPYTLATAIRLDDDWETQFLCMPVCGVDVSTRRADCPPPLFRKERLAARHGRVTHCLHKEVRIVLVSCDFRTSHWVEVKSIIPKVGMTATLEGDLAYDFPFRFHKDSRSNPRSDLLQHPSK